MTTPQPFPPNIESETNDCDLDSELVVLSDIIIDTFLEKKKHEREHPPPPSPD